VATLLKVMETDDGVPQSEPVAVQGLVEDMARDELVSLVERLVEHDPRLIDQIKRERARLTGEASHADGSA
jgi:hypothetical protein